MRSNVTLAYTPMNRSTKQSLPNRGELSPNDWQFSTAREIQTWGLPADQQSDNWFDMNEGYKAVKNGMFGIVPKDAPVYGHMNEKRSVQQLNDPRPINTITGDVSSTRIQLNTWNIENIVNPASKYPHRPDYYNFQGSQMR